MQRKALYNLLKFTSSDKKPENVKDWQIEDLKDFDDETLFNKLKKLNINLDVDDFLKVANQVDTPEAFSSYLSEDKELEEQDKIYLVVFELWKRLVKEKKTISIFADEFDHQIFSYDRDLMENDEPLQDQIAYLKNILDINVESGLNEKEAFSEILKFFAHDIENFLIDYAFEQIEIENYTYAFDIIDSFYPYVNKKLWFDFLKAKLFAKEDILKSNQIILDILKNKPSLELQIRILDFMKEIGDRKLFLSVAKNSLDHLENEKDFKKILKIVSDFFQRLDKEKIEKEILSIFNRRSEINNEDKINKKDQDLNDLKKIIS